NRRAPLRAAARHAGRRRNPPRHSQHPRIPAVAPTESVPRGRARALSYLAGICARFLNQASALPSDGARQSPRGESEPPEPTLGAFGTALLLYWLIWKKRRRKTALTSFESATQAMRYWISVFGTLALTL